MTNYRINLFTLDIIKQNFITICSYTSTYDSCILKL